MSPQKDADLALKNAWKAIEQTNGNESAKWLVSGLARELARRPAEQPRMLSPEKCPAAGTMTEPNQQHLIEVVSDTICPWCYIGLRRLDKALQQIDSSAGHFTVRHLPFQLNPTMPTEGMDRRTYRSAKFGSWERSLALDAQVTQAGREEGIGFRHDLADRTPNTLASHVLIHFAYEQALQASVVEAVFRGYFTEGKDIGRVDVLATIGHDAGWNSPDLARSLEDSAARSKVADAADNELRRGVSGVPTFRLNGVLLASGAQPPEVLADAILTTLFGRRS